MTLPNCAISASRAPWGKYLDTLQHSTPKADKRAKKGFYSGRRIREMTFRCSAKADRQAENGLAGNTKGRQPSAEIACLLPGDAPFPAPRLRSRQATLSQRQTAGIFQL
jgi:hypothetical protein